MRNMSRRRAVLFVLLTLCAAPIAFAQSDSSSKPVIDQTNTTFDSSINVNDPAYEWQQGITPTISGRLMRLDLFVDPSQNVPGPTQFTLYSDAPWQTSPPAWQQLVTLGPGWNSIHLAPAQFLVTAGQTFTVGLHCPGDTYCGAPFVGFSYRDAYSGGALFLNGVEQVGDDLMFQAVIQPR